MEACTRIMLSCITLPRYDDLQQLYNIFAYLKKHHNHNEEMLFDPSEPQFNKSLYERQDWSYSVYVKLRYYVG